MGPNTAIVFMIAILVIFGIYRRIRRNIGWQPLERRKLIVRTCIFCIIGFIFLSGGIFHPISLISDVVGILLGVILAYYGAALTKFEQHNGGTRYLPNIWIGSTVTVIFLARLFYRFYKMASIGAFTNIQQQSQAANGYQNMNYAIGNSWTTGLMLIMFAYYIFYYLFLINKEKQLSKSLIKE